MTLADDYSHVLAPPSITVSNASFSNLSEVGALGGSETFSGVDYFQGIIDTSKYIDQSNDPIICVLSNSSSLGSKSM